MKKGFIIGKFYPLHSGHSYLIEYALKRVDELTVAVCHAKEQRIPAELREQWIREQHPGVKTMIVQDIYTDTDSKAWAGYTKKFLGYVPDVVFTSEDYGDAYAKYLGSTHVLVDRARATVPISGTKVRQNPYDSWQFLAPCVRAFFVKRVCVIGAESTGTTTLARDLARYYHTTWVPEYGRLYSEGKIHDAEGSVWHTDEFIHIAGAQNNLEDFMARYSNRIMICDTDSFATSLWHERYMGFLAKSVDEVSLKRSYDLYLVTNDEIPFVQDGTRDGEHIRHSMQQRFMAELKKRKKKFVVLAGSRTDRLMKAIRMCDTIMKQVPSL